ncbi:hypothetical protein ABZX85_46065 [Streptomyces sp. NPDC004539]|uniref:hypothetical protein n=1 Tax=Streptomyces sp. NPDC004539 TaxID=3154280 RepID=UPI0033ABF7A6
MSRAKRRVLGMIGALAGLIGPMLAAVPAGAAEEPAVGERAGGSVGILGAAAGCTVKDGTIWPVTGNWDGVGGDGVGYVTVEGGVLRWRLSESAFSGRIDYDFTYGDAGDVPVVGNWDGIGGDGHGIVRPVRDGNTYMNWEWHVRDSPLSTKYPVFSYGRAYVNDVLTYRPITGNWDGIGGDGPGVAGGNAGGSKAWHLRKGVSGGISDYDFIYGVVGDFPVTGDWDGIGGDTQGVVRPGQNADTNLYWHQRETLTDGPTTRSFSYGVRGDCPVTGNWDGIGGDTPGVARGTANGLEWHLRNTNS